MFHDGAHQTNEPACGRVSASKRNAPKAKACQDTLLHVRFEAKYIGQKGDGYRPPQLAVVIKTVPFPFPGDCQNSAAPDSWLSLPL
jgi:hypothetical protein